MAPTSTSLSNTTINQDSNATTKPQNSLICHPSSNADFETLASSIPYVVNAALNVPLAIAATFANLLVLLAMRHVTSLHLPSKLLLCTLVLTDLGVGLVVQSQFAVLLFIKAFHPHSVHHCSLFSSFTFNASLFSTVSLLTMTAISLDRYTALFFHLRYQQIVTTRRVCAVLIFIWSSSLVFALSNFWKKVLWVAFLLTGLPIYLLTISVAYIKIYRRLRGHHGQQVQPQASDQAQQQTGSTLNMAKYKRTASTMMWIYVLFVICYLPYLCAVSITSAIGQTSLTRCINEFFYTIVLLNSCLNPFFYCLRLLEVRTQVLNQLQQCFCRSPQH